MYCSKKSKHFVVEDSERTYFSHNGDDWVNKIIEVNNMWCSLIWKSLKLVYTCIYIILSSNNDNGMWIEWY